MNLHCGRPDTEESTQQDQGHFRCLIHRKCHAAYDAGQHMRGCLVNENPHNGACSSSSNKKAGNSERTEWCSCFPLDFN